MSYLARKITLSKWTKNLQFEITQETIDVLRNDIENIPEQFINDLSDLIGQEFTGEDQFFSEIIQKIGKVQTDTYKRDLRRISVKQHQPNNIPLDNLRSDLKCKDGRVSFWICDGNGEKQDQVVLALMTSPNTTNIDPFELVLIPIEEIHENGLEICDEIAGNTVVEGLCDRHRDVIIRSDSDLEKLAQIILTRIGKDNPSTYKKMKIREILDSAIQDGRLDIDKLHEKLRDKL